MNTDKDIKQIFTDYRPEIGESSAFMEALERRLDEVEEARQYNRKTVRKYWTVSIIAFLVGLALGAFVLFIILFRPESMTQLRLALEGVLLRFFAFRDMFIAFAILIAAALVIIPTILSRKHSILN